MSSALKVPFGRAKGMTIGEAESADLQWVRDKIAEKLAEDPGKAYADKDRAFISAVDAELARRGGAPAPATGAAPARQRPPAQRQPAQMTVAPRGEMSVVGGFADAARASAAIQEAAATMHLVSPAPVVASLPEGCEIAISAIRIDVEAETYRLAGKVGLGKVALDRIAAAAGITWDPGQSGRLDDGSDPHYCHYRAVAHYLAFDGQAMTLQGEVEIDARDGSPQIEEIEEKARGANRDPRKQILELRKFLLRHAESKAKNRAVRSLGVRTSYDPKELTKPFAVARIMFTGRSADPEIRRMFAARTADNFLGARAALYGGALPAPRAMQARAAIAPLAHPPPPMAQVVDTYGEEYGDYSDDYGEAHAHDRAAAAAERAAGQDFNDDRGLDPNNY